MYEDYEAAAAANGITVDELNAQDARYAEEAAANEYMFSDYEADETDALEFGATNICEGCSGTENFIGSKIVDGLCHNCSHEQAQTEANDDAFGFYS